MGNVELAVHVAVVVAEDANHGPTTGHQGRQHVCQLTNMLRAIDEITGDHDHIGGNGCCATHEPHQQVIGTANVEIRKLEYS
jgi:hypothetical protein